MEHRVKELLERLTVSQRIFVIVNLTCSLMKYRLKWTSRRASVHWVGGPRQPRRFERPIIGLLFACAIAFLEPRDFIYWCVLIGGGTALFLNMHTVYWLLPRRQYHWINKRQG
jgi:hypothetical protein